MRKPLIFIVVSLVGLAAPALATFHEMQIEQVIGGVNGDPTAQAIQLRMRFAGQNQVQNAKVVVYDATGSNAITLIQPPTSVSNAVAGDHILLVSSNFVNNTSPTTVPDFYLTNLIPASYLVAGRLTWEISGPTILWSVSWGGTNYTGPTTGSTINDPDGNFGPPFPGPLPSTSTGALLFTNTADALSLSNIVDYIVTPGAATFTNNARAGFTVVLPSIPPPLVTAITHESNDIRVTWTTTAGKTNVVQVTSGGANGNFTNNFLDLSPPIIVPGSGLVGTNYLDSGGATNVPTRYYRVRLAP
jgi:hypothetical protein